MKRKLLLSALLIAPLYTQAASTITDCVAQYTTDGALHVPCVSVEGAGLFSAEMQKEAENTNFSLKRTNNYDLQLKGVVEVGNNNGGSLIFACEQDKNALRLMCPTFIPQGDWFIEKFTYSTEMGTGGIYELVSDQIHYTYQATSESYDYSSNGRVTTKLSKVSFQVSNQDTTVDTEAPHLLSTTPFDESNSSIITASDTQSGINFISMHLELSDGRIASSSPCYLIDIGQYSCRIDELSLSDLQSIPVTAEGERKVSARFEIQDFAGNKAVYSSGGKATISTYPETNITIPTFTLPTATPTKIKTVTFSRPLLKSIQALDTTVIPKQNLAFILEIDNTPTDVNAWDYATMVLQATQSKTNDKKLMICNVVQLGKFLCNTFFNTDEQGGEWIVAEVSFHNHMHSKFERYILNVARSYYSDTEIEAVRVQLDNPIPIHATNTALPHLYTSSVAVEDRSTLSPHLKNIMINLEYTK